MEAARILDTTAGDNHPNLRPPEKILPVHGTPGIVSTDLRRIVRGGSVDLTILEGIETITGSEIPYARYATSLGSSARAWSRWAGIA